MHDDACENDHLVGNFQSFLSYDRHCHIRHDEKRVAIGISELGGLWNQMGLQ